MKQHITEKENLHLEWYKQAKKTMTDDEIKEFTDSILEGYHHDYGTQCHAVASAISAQLHNYLYKYGMTGMQSSFVTWGIIRQMFNIEVGAKLINYDKMLYPQYKDDFTDQSIHQSIFEALQNKAEDKLNDGINNERVASHMQSIVEGKVPFGYTLEEQ